MKPLAERLRPAKLDDFVNQEHLTGKNGIIRKMIQNNALSSFILWGPPGTGKTTLAHIIAKQTNRHFFKLNAVGSGVKQLREIIEKAKNLALFKDKTPILFIDEIHRFNKAQQDDLLESIEKGIIILIGSTTENPSFELIPALLSRCQVFILKPLEIKDLEIILQKALNDPLVKKMNIQIKEKNNLFLYSGGDARKLLNIFELIINSEKERVIITDELVEKVLQNTTLKYDKKGNYHYDLISAFIKSIRGSDPNAALYYLARLLESGEDIKFIGRRLIISAAEDIGLANPNALLLAVEGFKAVEIVGMPEARIILSEITLYLASSPKSNSAYKAINSAIDFVRKTGNQPVPIHLRNSPTTLTDKLGYGKNYKYPHDFENNFVLQNYFPENIENQNFYHPQNNPSEEKLKKRLENLWKGKYKF